MFLFLFLFFFWIYKDVKLSICFLNSKRLAFLKSMDDLKATEETSLNNDHSNFWIWNRCFLFCKTNKVELLKKKLNETESIEYERIKMKILLLMTTGVHWWESILLFGPVCITYKVLHKLLLLICPIYRIYIIGS